eukprot:3307712-Pyramimonas_sp.AAC.1
MCFRCPRLERSGIEREERLRRVLVDRLEAALADQRFMPVRAVEGASVRLVEGPLVLVAVVDGRGPQRRGGDLACFVATRCISHDSPLDAVLKLPYQSILPERGGELPELRLDRLAGAVEALQRRAVGVHASPGCGVLSRRYVLAKVGPGVGDGAQQSVRSVPITPLGRARVQYLDHVPDEPDRVAVEVINIPDHLFEHALQEIDGGCSDGDWEGVLQIGHAQDLVNLDDETLPGVGNHQVGWLDRADGVAKPFL